MYGFQPKSARGKTVPQLADGGPVPFGSRGVAAVRDLIPKMQAMGFQPAPPPAAPADTSNTARLRAMIPQMEAMGYKQQPQYLADGGMVHSIKGMLGLRPKTREELLASDAKAQERNREAAARVAERSAQQPAPATPAPQSAITDYAGMSAMQRREKEQGLKNGGMVKPHGFKAGGLIRGPGTGTSDSIETEKRPGTFIMPADSTQVIGPEALEELGEPEEMGEEAESMEGQGDAGDDESVPVALSNGEFEFTPEDVQALGESVLTVMRDATHKAAGKGDGKMRAAAGFAPAQVFADGGTVQEEEKKRLANQTAMYVRGAQESVANRPATPPTAPVSSPRSFTPVAAGFMPGTRAVFNESGKTIGDLAKQGRYAAAAGETARAALAYGPAVVDDVVGGALRSVAPTVVDAGKQFFGAGETAPAPAATPSTKTASATTPPAPPAPAQPSAVSAAPAVETTAAPAAQPLTAGPISTQNNAAAEALSTPRATGFVPGGAGAALPVPVVRNSTNDWAARKALENAATAASSITANGGRFDQSGPGDSPEVAAYKAALANDFALQQAQPGMEQAAMRENGANQRTAVQDAGATERTVIQDQGATAREAGRTALAGEELGLKRTAAGFQTRAAAQLESLQNAYTAEKDPAKQAILARQIRELQGKEQPARYKVAAGGQQIDANGVAYKVPDRVFNEQTGEFSDGATPKAPAAPSASGAPATPANKAQYDALPKGAQYIKNGVVYVKG
ncbi:hypothetical protein [Acidovorax sp. K2F]|uniref:hypothetical protein n=1 Tax=Acidovorax sp. K2F TaxID=2978125 RepID=UPI0021B0DC46|nr:hypothetical protein [Acidovorax sp. K2F]MCT6719427.1 hypothetical protein [Acidovorax sp. K2F]